MEKDDTKKIYGNPSDFGNGNRIPAGDDAAGKRGNNGTSDGTYDFGSLNDTGEYEGTGFKSQGDKFLVSQCFAQDGTVIYPNSTNAKTARATQDVVIKAEGAVNMQKLYFQKFEY
jgi:hypothetical protein